VAQELTHPVTLEEFLMSCAPFDSVAIAPALSQREVIVDLLDGNNADLGQFDGDRRPAFRVEH
jgi:hypothetical protein